MIKALRNFWMLAEEDEKKRDSETYAADPETYDTVGDCARLLYFIVLTSAFTAILLFKGIQFFGLGSVLLRGGI